MALSAGTRLGRYEILAPLGAGGMGEVWRAHDAKLNRDVAIKALPETLAADPERLARFKREADGAPVGAGAEGRRSGPLPEALKRVLWAPEPPNPTVDRSVGPMRMNPHLGRVP